MTSQESTNPGTQETRQNPVLPPLTGRTSTDDLLREIESLRTRLSRLSEASRRVSETLDLSTVLQEVIDNARYLTGARYGALLTYDESGGIQDFMTSGLSAEETERLTTLPQGLGLLGHMNEIREPLRLADIASHPSSVGFPDNHPPMKTFLGMPVRHQGEHVGNIYLTEKDGGQDFTGEDQEILVMFASQAGAAIFNARRYREEQQARTDLETLINISPVGVLLFDGKSGDLVSLNEEAVRILGRPNGPGPLKQVPELMNLRTADGAGIPEDELPVTRALRRGESVLAQEVSINLPDGRAITALVNARPIHKDSGEVLSVIATIQDITPLEEVKRQRVEFLNNVSHELRTPLSAIKGSASTLLNSAYPLDLPETRQFLRVIDEQSEHMRRLINELVDLTQIEAGDLTVNPEPTAVLVLLEQAKEAHLQPGQADANTILVDCPPGLPSVLADRRRVLQVLQTLLASISAPPSRPSTVTISALVTGVYVAISVDNDNPGAATLTQPHELRRGSATADAAVGTNNRREQLDIAIAVGIVEAHGGRLSVEEGDTGRPIAFTFTIPTAAEAHGTAAAPLPHYAGPALDIQGERARVLAVSSDPETIRYIRNTLSQAGFVADTTAEPEEAESLIEDRKPQVVLLDQSPAADDAFDTLGRVCRASDAPVILIAGAGWDHQIAQALEAGASDYIAKPFTTTELLTRTEMAIRRQSAADWANPARRYIHADLVVDYTGRQASLADRTIHLTATEYKLLEELSKANGQVLPHNRLLTQVWGPLYAGDPSLLRTYIRTLRRKLGDQATHPTYIFTEPGLGYRMPRMSTP